MWLHPPGALSEARRARLVRLFGDAAEVVSPALRSAVGAALGLPRGVLRDVRPVRESAAVAAESPPAIKLRLRPMAGAALPADLRTAARQRRARTAERLGALLAARGLQVLADAWAGHRVARQPVPAPAWVAPAPPPPEGQISSLLAPPAPGPAAKRGGGAAGAGAAPAPAVGARRDAAGGHAGVMFVWLFLFLAMFGGAARFILTTLPGLDLERSGGGGGGRGGRGGGVARGGWVAGMQGAAAPAVDLELRALKAAVRYGTRGSTAGGGGDHTAAAAAQPHRGDRGARFDHI